jgi:dihydropteroate synthase
MPESEIRNLFNARAYGSRRAEDLRMEMARLGSEEPGIARMLPKAAHFVVKLHGVRTPAALILKEEMLAKGGDAAIHRDCITNRVERSDVLLMGSEKTFNLLVAHLHAQPFSLPRIADEIKEALRSYTAPSPQIPAESELPERLKPFYSALRTRTAVMGVLNVTPDSFSDGGLYADTDAAIRHGLRMSEDGADVIDVGGESTRPGAEAVSAEEELSRVIPVIQALCDQTGIPISVDTYKPEVAREALDAGAGIINDIMGLADPEMRSLAAERRVPSILMHMKGTPRTMQEDPVYEDVISEIMAFLRERVEAVVGAGLPREYLIVDPGIGFGKTAEHNLEIIRKLADLKSIGLPILIGPSRKAFIGKVLGDLPPTERLEGTAAAVALSIANGANIVRVHDVKEMVRVARVSDAVVRTVDKSLSA